METEVMVPTIRVDDEVFALLQSEATAFVDTPNSVLRRKLGLGDLGGTTGNSAPAAKPAGRLRTLVDAGVLASGDELIWHRRQQQKTYHAPVRSDGGITVMGLARAEHDSPSSAAREAAGYVVNGWKVWRHTRTGLTLDELWAEYCASVS